MLVEGKPLALSAKIVKMRGEPVGVLRLHDVQRFRVVRPGETVGADSATARDDGRRHEPVVESRRDHRGLSVARGAGDDESRRVDGGIRLEVVRDARSSPGPCRQDAPVVAWICWEEARRAKGPAPVGEGAACCPRRSHCHCTPPAHIPDRRQRESGWRRPPPWRACKQLDWRWRLGARRRLLVSIPVAAGRRRPSPVSVLLAAGRGQGLPAGCHLAGRLRGRDRLFRA